MMLSQKWVAGVKQERRKVHGSLYRSLRTNLPRHVMAFTDFPFDFCVTGSDDDRLFCGHEEVRCPHATQQVATHT